MQGENQAKASRPMSDEAHRTFSSNKVPEANLPSLDGIREDAAHFWDRINGIPSNKENGRMIALAKTKLEESAMWATKALSRL